MGRKNFEGGAEETNGVEGFQDIGLEICEIVADDDAEGTRFEAHLGEGDFAGGDRGVPEAVGFRKNEKFAGFFRFGESLLGKGGGNFFEGTGGGLFKVGALGDHEECTDCDGDDRWDESFGC